MYILIDNITFLNCMVFTEGCVPCCQQTSQKNETWQKILLPVQFPFNGFISVEGPPVTLKIQYTGDSRRN